MEWKNREELRLQYRDKEFLEKFGQLYSLSTFFQTGLVPQDYVPPDAFEKMISVTPYGATWLKRLHKQFKGISESEALFALFAIFNHLDLFVDVYRCNYDDLLNILRSEILSKRIKFPWVYGRDLYDRFYDMFPATTDALSYEQTQQLLEKTPEGVFQLRDLLIGPFGVLHSFQQRDLGPLRTVPLWHCSDPVCQALHPVLLASGQCKANEAAEFLSNECERIEGVASEWNKFFSDVDGSPDWYDDMHLRDLPWLLANSFSEGELRFIFERLMTKHSAEMRACLPETKRLKKSLSGSASEIAKRLKKDECLHLILLQNDSIITGIIESLIDDSIIRLPSTEIRNIRFMHGSSGWFYTTCQCSRYGIRSISSNRRQAVAFARLKRILKELYRDEIHLSRLEWSLRHVPGKGIYEKLDHYLHTNEPAKALADLVFAGPEFLKSALSAYHCQSPQIPMSSDEEKRTINRLLWKMGFNVALYPEHQEMFWRRLEHLLKVSRTNSDYTEIEREAIRSAAVNLFVSLEEILDYSLSFITWVLLSDHFGDTKFKCNLDKARQIMAKRLNGRQLGSNEPLRIDPNGKNTLYPLVQGFAVLGELCKEILEGKHGDLIRSENELPGYHGKTEIDLFPFLHKVLLLDIRKYDQNRILDLLKEVTVVLEKSRICDVRNRLEHKRTDFPKREEIETALVLVSDMLTKMEEGGICPLVYIHNRTTRDYYGRSISYFKDYKGREVSIYSPSQYRPAVEIPLDAPIILVPLIHVSESTQILSFRFSDTSEYEIMWASYPKRRTRYKGQEKVSVASVVPKEH